MRAALMRLKRDAQALGEPTAASPAAGPPLSRSTRRTAIGVLAGAAAGATAMGLFGVSRRQATTARRLTRFSIPLPEGFVAEASANKRVAISPDGSRVAYTASAPGQGQALGANKFYLRSIAALEPKVLT